MRRIAGFFSFRGRATRRELFFVAIVFAPLAVGVIAELWTSEPMRSVARARAELLFAPVTFLLIGATAVRRLHDMGRSGLWILAALPAAGALLWANWTTWRDALPMPAHPSGALQIAAMLAAVALFWVVQLAPEDVGRNCYGPDPRLEPARGTAGAAAPPA